MSNECLPRVLGCINLCLFRPQLISLKTRLEFELRAFIRNSNYSVHSIDKELLVLYPSLTYGYTDQIKMRDYIYPVVECWFYGTDSRIILRNNKIQFLNRKIDDYFKYESDFEQNINDFDLNDIFALSTIINGSISENLISTLITEYKELKKNKCNIFMHIQRYK